VQREQKRSAHNKMEKTHTNMQSETLDREPIEIHDLSPQERRAYGHAKKTCKCGKL